LTVVSATIDGRIKKHALKSAFQSVFLFQPLQEEDGFGTIINLKNIDV